MKRTFMKFLPIAAAILLATSCSKDGDNGDSNVVIKPDPETTEVVNTPDVDAKRVPFTIKAVPGNSLSKISYAEDGTKIALKFDAKDKERNLKLIVSDKGGVHTAELPLTEVDVDAGTATFSGVWDEKNGAPDDKTPLTATLAYNEGSSFTTSTTSIFELMGVCAHNYTSVEGFKYGDETVTLADDNSYLEISWPNNPNGDVDISDETYTLNDKGELWIKVDKDAEIYSTAFGIDKAKAKKAQASTIHSIKRDHTVEISGAPTGVCIWGSTETIDLTAVAKDEGGNVASDPDIQWSVTSGRATVAADGKVTITGLGKIVVTATSLAYKVAKNCVIKISEDYVDLGITNSDGTKVLWATKNIGAENPEDYGDYYAWGELTTKDYYDWDQYRYYGEGRKKGVTKYSTRAGISAGRNYFYDDLTVLERADVEEDNDDVAYQRDNNTLMPTIDDFSALRGQCYSVWTEDYKGVKGYFMYKALTDADKGKVINRYSTPDDAYATGSVPYIFLPANGCRKKDNLEDCGFYGQYWSSSLYTSNSSDACMLCFRDDWFLDNPSTSRCYGCAVRPVRYVN
ncbi:MAG: hypothetical protein II852_08165 [Bacteroidales bacterium]|nr:hypothetical protein [Bacteroidales bacterium]